MDEAAIRQLVRDALHRHLHGPGEPPPGDSDLPLPGSAAPWKAHPSHVRFLTLAPGDGSCIVEPAVACSHCGFCQSYGH
jgi:hypothetical protein